MTRQRTRLSRIAGRAATGLVSLGLIAATVLLAPSAAATPEADADAAITAAWETGGGEGGPLGPRDGGVYPAGEGFGQKFAGGQIFFSPETGAHIVTGAILEKYESLGGPADSDLGFPTIDEGPGRAANSRNSTFNAPDNPVIFWTPETGARVVRGAINSAWDALGGSAGVLGVPSEDESTNGDVLTQKFTGGEISWNRKTRTFSTVPPELADQLGAIDVPSDATSAINAARRAAGGALGPLGAEEGAQYAIGADGVGQNYAGGKIFYSPETGANVVTGQVLAKYESLGGPTGDLGFPTASEADGGLAPQSRVVPFAAEDDPVIFWTPDFGAVVVRGAMNAAWQKLGGATGELGAPKSDQTDHGNVVTQQFNGGSISWDRTSGKFSTEPSGLQSQLIGLEVPGADAPAAPAPEAAGDSDSGGGWFSWWWLLGLIPLIGVIGLVVAAVLRNRRAHEDEAFDDGYGDGYEDDSYGRGYNEPEYKEPEYKQPEYGEPEPSGYGSQNLWASAPPVGEVPTFGTLSSSPDPEDNADNDEFDDFADESGEYNPEEGFADVSEDNDELEDEAEDPDAVDTAPTRIETLPEEETFEQGYEEPGYEPPTTAVSLGGVDFPSGRHAAIPDDEPEDPGWTSMRLATEDRYRAPEGYPIKADTKTGLYWAPGSPGYRDTEAEIWFASEEFARTNGFVRAD